MCAARWLLRRFQRQGALAAAAIAHTPPPPRALSLPRPLAPSDSGCLQVIRAARGAAWRAPLALTTLTSLLHHLAQVGPYSVLVADMG